MAEHGEAGRQTSGLPREAMKENTCVIEPLRGRLLRVAT